MSAEPPAATVVYVEDDVLTQHLVQTGLNDAGFAVIVACDADDGLDILETRGHEIVGLVADIKLGKGPDGWAVARRARELHPAAGAQSATR